MGYCIDLYADFARQGKNYVPFPDKPSHRIFLDDLRDEGLRETLRQVWTDPLALDPTRRSTRVTKALAENLAKVAASLERGGRDPDAVAGFLMRCLFTMFAEDVGLLPERSFTGLLEQCRGAVDAFPKALESLWATMDEGGYEPALMTDVRRFNGHLFKDHAALQVSEAQLELLIKAAEADWADVEPAIFGTLLERALDMTGGYRVSPEQLLGLEINPRAAAIADVVLWIGYLQWHFRTYGSADRLDPPILKSYDNIQHRDAVLAYDEKVPRTDDDGQPITRWDRRTYREDPTTGERVPDESAQEPVFDYTNPRPADWPEAEFIVGNPPFIGNKRMRDALGDGYTEAVRKAYAYKVRKDSDYVMLWWYKAAKAVRKGLDGWGDSAEHFGLISTNSIGQTSNRKLIKKQMGASPPISLAFAIPDHPWVASADGSDVRIAMTVGAVTDQPGTLQTVTRETQSTGAHWDVELKDSSGKIQPDLTVGPDVVGAEPLEANMGMSYMGVIPVGLGFRLDPEEIEEMGYDLDDLPCVIRPYLNGSDVAGNKPLRYIIDFFGLEKDEAREEYPQLYQRVRDRVKPDRDNVRRKNHRKYWWIFGEARPAMRDALSDLERYIITVETSKHQYFTFLPSEILPDQKLRVIASDDPYHLGVLSSQTHEVWSLAAGGRHVDRPVYNNTRCFDPFPFPAATEAQQQRIRELGEQLDRHRKTRLAAHEGLTMTALYNVLEKERASEPLDDDERQIHEQGLVGVLKELHDELDAAVAAAYGWDPGLPDEDLLQRLVALNAERRAEEEEGHVRYLRPAYQAPEEAPTQGALDLDLDVGGDGAPAEPLAWPSALKDRAQAVRAVMHHAEGPLTVEQVARHFHRARRRDVRELLDALAGLGLVEQTEDGAFAG